MATETSLSVPTVATPSVQGSIDTTQVTTAAGTVQRQAVSLADPTSDNRATVSTIGLVIDPTAATAPTNIAQIGGTAVSTGEQLTVAGLTPVLPVAPAVDSITFAERDIRRTLNMIEAESRDSIQMASLAAARLAWRPPVDWRGRYDRGFR